jgi:hypothetical protein
MVRSACTWNWETRIAYRILVGISLGKCPLKDRRKHENNIKIDLRETGCEDGTGKGSCPTLPQY